ncbi:MAG: S23 ribosomal protein [Parcubacteria group bacterium Gr01-1014_2]|nr:MAG: S23 ribosomal protein [Parcubacteria group bacterium Gr01-1014_2]
MENRIEYGFQKLEVWKLARKLVSEIYRITKLFPKEEQFSLSSQLRRAAISVPLNIAEGSARRTKKDFASFIRIAMGSLLEVYTCIEIANDEKYINISDYNKVKSQIQEIYFKLVSLDKFLTGKNK